MFLVTVHGRTAETLLATIKEWVLPSSTIISGCWSAYNPLEDDGYTHNSESYDFIHQ
jgi:hypothetical protein